MVDKAPYQLMEDLTEEEYAALKADIAERGILVPIELDEAGNVLDGHHRVRAWQELRADGVKAGEYPRIIRPGLTEQDKRNHVRVLNLIRRHMPKDKQLQLWGTMRQDGLSLRAIAEASGVDKETVRQAVVENSTPKTITGKDGKTYPARKPRRTPAIIAKDSREEKSALQTATAELPDHMIDAKRAGRLAREQEAARRREDPTPIPALTMKDADIRHGEFVKALADIEASSVSLILTDPPYIAPRLDIWEDLASLATRILKPGGLLATYTGQFHLPKVMGVLGSELQYLWTCAMLARGPKALVHARRIYSAWKPVLLFCKPPYTARDWFDDLFKGAGPEKELHDWQQRFDEAAHLVFHLSDPGDLVVDPCLGSGTTALAAVKQGRRFIGCDSDKAAVASAVERLEKREG